MTAAELVEKHLEAGADHYEAGRLDDALSDWWEAHQIDPLDPDVHYNLGIGLSDSGLPVEAVHHWREPIRLKSDFYEPYYRLICAMAEETDRDESRWRDVRTLCGYALALDAASTPQEAYLRRLQAVAEWSLGERRKAIETMTAALAVEPDLWTYEWLSQMQARTGQWRASLRTFLEMTELADYDSTWYEPCCRRLQTMGVVAVLAGSALLAWRLTRRR